MNISMRRGLLISIHLFLTLMITSSLSYFIDVIMIFDMWPYTYCKYHTGANEIDQLNMLLCGASDDGTCTNSGLYQVRFGAIIRHHESEEFIGVFENYNDLNYTLSSPDYYNCTPTILDATTDKFPESPIMKLRAKKKSDAEIVKTIMNNAYDVTRSASESDRIAWMLRMFKSYVFKDWNSVNNKLNHRYDNFWSEKHERIAVFRSTPWEDEEEIYNSEILKDMDRLKAYERYISEMAARKRITIAYVTSITSHPCFRQKYDHRKYCSSKPYNEVFRVNCAITPYFDPGSSIIRREVARYVSPAFNDAGFMSLRRSGMSEFGHVYSKTMTVNKRDDQNVAITTSACILKAINTVHHGAAFIPDDESIVNIIRSKFMPNEGMQRISKEQTVKLLSNPYENTYGIKSERYIRSQAPNLFSFGKFDTLSTLYCNKKKVHKPYPNEIASNASDEDAKQILRQKIEKTSDLLAGGNSFIECSGLIMANKFLSNAYTLARYYIETHIDSMNINDLLKPMYIEPVFVISAAQAFYCTIIRDEYSVLREKFINPKYERCPFVYVVMYATFDHIDPVVGLPVPKINLDIRFDACQDNPNLTTWIPKKSCVSPDPYLLPFGLRTSMMYMRVLNIMDIIKSEDNYRNINYSLSSNPLVRPYPDDIYPYEHEAGPCKTHLLELFEDAHDIINPYGFYHFDIPDDEYLNVVNDNNTASYKKVFPNAYSEFNIKPFIPASMNEMIKIGTKDAGHIYSTMPHEGIDRREETLEYGLWDLVVPDPNRHKYITDIASDMSQYNIDNCYARMWGFNSTMNGRADFESNTINTELLELSKFLPINGRPFIGMSYSPFIDDVM